MITNDSNISPHRQRYSPSKLHASLIYIHIVPPRNPTIPQVPSTLPFPFPNTERNVCAFWEIESMHRPMATPPSSHTPQKKESTGIANPASLSTIVLAC